MGRRIHRDICIRGVFYATVGDAAVALNVQQQTVLKAIKVGRLDAVGLGESHPVPLPVHVRGKTYACAAEAAEALHLSKSAIWNAIGQGRADTVGLVIVRPRKGKPFQIGPLHFDSLVEADRQLGFRAGYVSHALRKGRAGARQKVLGAAMAYDLARNERRIRNQVALTGISAVAVGS